MSALRLLGALAVTGACTLWGLLKAAALRRSADTVSALCCVLEQLRWEITALCTPLPELIERLASDAPLLCRDWLESLRQSMAQQPEARFSSLWQEALAQKPDLLPPGEAREALSLLGQSLGRFDASAQGEAISRCLRTLERAGAEAAEKARTGGRLYSGLGLSAGVILVIFLL